MTAAERLQQYYALEKQIDTERTKPIEKQNYTNIKIALEKLTAGTDKASRYAKFTLGQIKHYQLAINVNKALKQQDVQMSSTIKKIKKAHDKKVAGFEDLGRFAAIGKFAISRIYGQERAVRHYTISDASGKVICYALPTGSAANVDKYLGQRVGLVGAIEPHQPTSGALVRFTKIVKLKKK